MISNFVCRISLYFMRVTKHSYIYLYKIHTWLPLILVTKYMMSCFGSWVMVNIYIHIFIYTKIHPCGTIFCWFFENYRSVEPWLKTRKPPEDGREHRQSPSDRNKLDGLYECILCACCTTSCPSYWWNPEEFPGPAALLQAYRWISDR